MRSSLGLICCIPKWLVVNQVASGGCWWWSCVNKRSMIGFKLSWDLTFFKVISKFGSKTETGKFIISGRSSISYWQCSLASAQAWNSFTVRSRTYYLLFSSWLCEPDRSGIIRVGHSESLKTINTMYNSHLLTFYLTAWDTSYRAQPHASLTCNIRSPIFRIVCKFASMLLLLTIVYLLHSFQTHAAPLTTLLVESCDTVLSTAACICPADQRSLWDILWSCLATIFACSWVSVHPNIPASNESWWRISLRRLELMFWAVVSPEMIISWAFRQWFGARDLEKLYKGGQMYPIYSQILNLEILNLEKGFQWTKTHGHFIQMGGFMLFEGEIPKSVLTPKRFSELLAAGKIEFPTVTVTVEEIEDRSKADARKRSPSSRHCCGSSRSVLREELSILTSLLSSC